MSKELLEAIQARIEAYKHDMEQMRSFKTFHKMTELEITLSYMLGKIAEQSIAIEMLVEQSQKNQPPAMMYHHPSQMVQ